MIRYAPAHSDHKERELHTVDLKRGQGDLAMLYAFPYGDHVELSGLSGLRLHDQISRLELLEISKSGITSRHPLSLSGSAHLEQALLPLIADFRASAARLAVLFWADLASDFWRSGFIPVLALDLRWGPKARSVEVKLKRHAGTTVIEWRKLDIGPIQGQLDSSAARLPAELASPLRAVASNRRIAAEAEVLFRAGERANARMMASAPKAAR